MRTPELLLSLNEMIVDNFAGGGGASTGIFAATGRHPDIAVNHDPEALALYRANHPGTRVFCEDVFNVKPRFVVGRRKVGLAWFSPDCTHFSKARGKKPKSRKRRGLAGVALKWAEQVRPRVVFIENVEEFKTWGPLGEDGQPDPSRIGQSFKRWIKRWRNLGYAVDWRELRACDYGAPTTRKRLFIIARCDGEVIQWPVETHGPKRSKPYRTAAECIDWSIPCPSIFTRKKPLQPATLRRIAHGIMRYVVGAEQPFIVPLTHQGNNERVYSVENPFPTVTGANRGEMAVVSPIIVPFIAGVGGRQGQSPERSVNRPYQTITTKADSVVVAPTLVQMCYGERKGQAPRVLNLHDPLGTVMAEGVKHGLVTAFLTKNFGGTHKNGKPKSGPGSDLRKPMGTATSTDHNALVSAWVMKMKGTCKDGQPMTQPLDTVQAQGLHYAEVRAFLIKYYGTDQDPKLSEPLHTITTKDRFGLVIVLIGGVEYAIVDIGMRMLSPRELYNAQGFPVDYVIDPVYNGKQLTKTAQVHKCGNSVPPPFSEALVRAQFSAYQEEEMVG